MRIAFDIGGVLSKYPDVFRPLFTVLAQTSLGVDVYVISDMKPKEKALDFLSDNGFLISPGRVFIADYDANGEECKAVRTRRSRTTTTPGRQTGARATSGGGDRDH